LKLTAIKAVELAHRTEVQPHLQHRNGKAKKMPQLFVRGNYRKIVLPGATLQALEKYPEFRFPP
jgi:hypothetical protein